MLAKRKPTALKKRLRRCICLALAVLILSLVYFETAVRVQLRQSVVTGVKQTAQTAIDSAVSGFLEDNEAIGEKLSSISFSDSGEVSAVTTDPAYINFVKSEIASRAAEAIDELSRSRGVRVPVGSFTGLALLSDLGPETDLRIDTNSAVSCILTSSLESAGINQTVHHISLTVTAEVAVYDPFRLKDTIKVSSDFEIAQTVIVGSVPSYGGVVTY